MEHSRSISMAPNHVQDAAPEANTERSAFPSSNLRSRLISIFASTHHMLELCGCISLDTLNSEDVSEENEFLLYSIFALSSLYLVDSDVQPEKPFNTSKSIVRHCRAKAQAASRQTSDQPTLITIQANLVLGLCELLGMATSKAWLHIGLAIRLAQCLRMRNEYNRRLIPRHRETRRRTFWACVLLDRLIAYCTFRTQTIDLGLVGIHLPCTETAFAFGQDRIGPKVADIGEAVASGADVPTLSYFMKTFLLWSPIARVYVDGGRRTLTASARDPTSPYRQYEAEMKAWRDCLPSEMQWSEGNLRAHLSLGQLSHFINIHFLIHHSLFLVHHEFLPHIEDEELQSMNGSPRSWARGTGWLNQTDLDTVSSCLQIANRIVSMLRLIDTVVPESRHLPLNICSGTPAVTTASVLLWAHYCSDKIQLSTPLEEGTAERARIDADYVLQKLDAWAKTWSLARAWANSIRLLDDFYQTRYASKSSSTTMTPDMSNLQNTSRPRKEAESMGVSRAASPTLQDGDGFPDVTMIPQETYYKVRMITGLVMGQPELCKKFLQKPVEQLAEATEEEVDPWGLDLDFSWMNDPDFMVASSLWADFALQVEE